MAYEHDQLGNVIGEYESEEDLPTEDDGWSESDSEESLEGSPIPMCNIRNSVLIQRSSQMEAESSTGRSQ